MPALVRGNRVARRTAAFAVSQIREMTRLADQHGAVNLAQGLPELDPPPALLEALRQLPGGPVHQYSYTWGLPALLEVLAGDIAHRWGAPVDPLIEVTVTCGVSEGLVATMLALIDPGDEVIVLEPVHENYVPAILFAGASPRFLPLDPPDFRLDAGVLRALVTPRTRALLLNTPHNPTGRVFDREELETVRRVCLDHDLLLITDEIYADLVYSGRHLYPAALPDLRSRTVALYGVGKSYSATGWRLGYVVAPADLSAAIRKVHEYLVICAATPLQAAVASAWPAMGEYAARAAADYRRRRDTLVTALQEAGLACTSPQAAYYVMADAGGLGFDDDVAAARTLVTQVGVATVPGSSFYPGHPERGRTLLRFVFCKHAETIAEAARRLRAFAAGSGAG
ncbi:MAG TPA: aminotransferase class I/II-fold pyridoxal phosphate-dependent enzyme [Bacillota bacterium]